MTFKTSRIAAIAAIAGAACGGASIANAVTKRTGNQTATTPATPKGNPNEKALTGDTLKSASDAAIAANAGAKVVGATTEDPAENTGAAYEVHITKADGTHATVLEDSSFKVLSTKTEQRHDGHGDHGGPGGNPNETALTGVTLKSASDAAIAANAGAKVDGATTEDPAENTGAAYEVHITRADATHATVLLDKSFKVIKTETHGDRRHG